MPRAPLRAALLLACVGAAACSFQRGTTSGNPAAPSSVTSGTTTGVSSQSLLGGWVSTKGPLNPKSCGNFQYQIASQTSNSIAGTFTATCDTMVVSAHATGTLVGNSVAITINGSGDLPGLTGCKFSISSNATVEDNGNALRIPYSGTTCVGPVSGTEVLRRPSPASPSTPTPAPNPNPTPTPTPTPAPTPTPSGPTDAIDLHSVIVTARSPQDVANWAVTTAITSMDFGSTGVRVDFSKKDGPGRWPDVVPPGWDGSLQYTLWMVVYIDGRWYTSGGAEYWYGLDRQGGPPNEFAYNWYYSPDVWGPLANHQPASGERVGFFVTAGDARAKDVRTVNERSNVVVVPFPSSGGYFTFSLKQALGLAR